MYKLYIRKMFDGKKNKEKYYYNFVKVEDGDTIDYKDYDRLVNDDEVEKIIFSNKNA